ncbi:ABC transporter ATP-binding protein [Jiangella mangrovi]|uniref:Nickel import system ATP-binding protein NikD n=1 Tax=Jiangella mangrovi TaxID=1524084 RepID=A0A7W9GUR2_9ACTN|nr:ABC transporter ATP-binding protein [Jiangella mangrovi]MBB5790134.1 ABC-type glutathione transport system ATPase component [Jiangella mangrovi]
MTGLLLDDVSIRIPLPGTPRRWVHAADGVNLRVAPGEVTAIVGESGCGKSVLAQAIAGLLPAGTRTSGSIRLGSLDLLALSDATFQPLRGKRVGLIPQSAATHLTPVRTVGSTMAETLRLHGVRTGVDEVLADVGLPPGTAHRYPHELSGGMAQRVLVALTLALHPDVLVADEPTSALDPETTDLVLARLAEEARNGSAVVLITHDLVAARTVADTVGVMYAGRLLEVGPAATVLHEPRHDYAATLLAALPENGLRPAPGTPSSLVDPEPGVCAWHTRVGLACAPGPVATAADLVACVPAGRS